LAATDPVADCCVSPPEQVSAPRTLYIGFRKAKLKKAKENMGQCKSKDRDFKSYAMQFLDMAAIVCKSEHQDFKKAKGRTWDSTSLRAKTLREIMLKKAKRKHGTG
jgi:hypothetical protein